MQNAASVAIGLAIMVTVGLAGYWFWVPDVGALRTWDEFLALPDLECAIGDVSVKGLTGNMYITEGKLRADYEIEGEGVSSTFHTIVYRNQAVYTWADNIPFAERATLNLGEGSTEENLFKISRCKRVWDVDPNLFALPAGLQFRDR